MTVLFSAVAFLVLLSVLILIHELGHYAAAKKAGVEVEEFGLGMPPRVKTLFKRKGTDFSLNWIPFGGFVRLKGENAIDAKEHTAPGSFGAASVPAKISILCAGVFMNFLLAFVLLTLGFSFGKWIPISVYSSLEQMESAAANGVINLELGVRIDEVISGGGAAKVGVPADSFLIEINDQPITSLDDVIAFQQDEWRVKYTVLTGENMDTEEEYKVLLEDGKSGVSLVAYPLQLSGKNHSIPRAAVLAVQESWMMMKQTAYGIGQLFMSLAKTGTVPDGIAGIVGIAQYTHTSVQEGMGAYLRLVALLSLSLVVLNILPFPALDGGRLLFVLAEVVSRRPMNRKFEIVTNSVGFIFLILLLLLITYHDITRLF